MNFGIYALVFMTLVLGAIVSFSLVRMRDIKLRTLAVAAHSRTDASKLEPAPAVMAEEPKLLGLFQGNRDFRPVRGTKVLCHHNGLVVVARVTRASRKRPGFYNLRANNGRTLVLPPRFLEPRAS